MSIEDQQWKAEIEALRAETAQPEAKSLLLERLGSQRENKAMKIVKTSLLVAAAAGLAGILILTPKAEAANMGKVLQALKQARDYHIRSYRIDGTKRALAGETWVKDGARSSVIYDSKGKAHPLMFDPSNVKMDRTSSGNNQVTVTTKNAESKDGQIKVLTRPGQSASISVQAGDGSTFGGVVTDGKMLVTGSTSVELLTGILQKPGSWKVAKGTWRGKDVQICTLDKTVTLYIEPATSRPIFLKMKTGQLLTEDEYDYTPRNP